MTISKDEALVLAEEQTLAAESFKRRADALATANNKLKEQLTHVPSLPATVTGGIAVTSAAVTSYADGFMTKPDAKPDEEETGASLAAIGLGAGIALASGKGKIKDGAIAAAEGAASGLVARQSFNEGRKARIKHEADLARAKAKAAEKGD